MTAAEVIESLIGARLELQDDLQVGQYWFGRHGYVAATLGVKNGGVCAPLFEYRIKDNETVEIGPIGPGGPMWQWEQLQINGDILTVLFNGKPRSFEIIRH
ncbi:MAG: hypothetical protein K8T91_00970 [Planctomycetes bacterium]|nr:hypothetical protein [Planctomycetota bacterium]